MNKTKYVCPTCMGYGKGTHGKCNRCDGSIAKEYNYFCDKCGELRSSYYILDKALCTCGGIFRLSDVSLP